MSEYGPDTLDALVEDFQPIARYECQIRASWLSKAGGPARLLPDYFANDQMGALADNAALYFQRLGFTPLSSTRSKNPIVYFTVDYLADLLNILSVWESEFSHLFAREVAMADDTLLDELLSIAKTPGAARRAADFYHSVRTYGFLLPVAVSARHSFMPIVVCWALRVSLMPCCRMVPP